LKVFQEHDDVLAGAFSYFAWNDLSVTVGNMTESLLGQYVSGGASSMTSLTTTDATRSSPHSRGRFDQTAR
jgi:N-acetylneuraminic acid mutarotase